MALPPRSSPEPPRRQSSRRHRSLQWDRCRRRTALRRTRRFGRSHRRTRRTYRRTRRPHTRQRRYRFALPTDITDRDAVLAPANRIATELGTVDLLFANAGVQLTSGISDVAVADWDAQIDLNIKSTMNTIPAFIGPLEGAAAPGGPADLIVTSSTAAVRYLEGFQVYSATKAYLTQLTRLLRMEWNSAEKRSAFAHRNGRGRPSASKLMADLTEIHILPTEQSI